MACTLWRLHRRTDKHRRQLVDLIVKSVTTLLLEGAICEDIQRLAASMDIVDVSQGLSAAHFRRGHAPIAISLHWWVSCAGRS